MFLDDLRAHLTVQLKRFVLAVLTI